MQYYIGWDVGAWKCKAGRGKSCDALVVLGNSGIEGFCRENMSSFLSEIRLQPLEERAEVFIDGCFLMCCDQNGLRFSPDDEYYVAIDTPLGWSKDFTTLLNGTLPEEWSYDHGEQNIQNTLLYRYTEREKLAGAMSVIVESIGSQSVKGLVLLKTLGAEPVKWGVWKVGNVTLFETYPKACLVSDSFVQWISELKLKQSLTQPFLKLTNKNPNQYESISVISEDLFDAGICACVAKAYAEGKPKLVSPTGEDPIEYKDEGWVFYPDERESDVEKSIADGHSVFTCHERKETFHEAISAFQDYVALKRKIKENPKNAQAYQKRGNRYKEIGENDKAKKDFATAKKLGYKP